MYKRILIFTFALLLISGHVTSLFAQENQISIELPAIGINDLIMKSYNFTPGKNVAGKLFIENITKDPADFKYKFEIYSNRVVQNQSAQVLLGSSPLSNVQVLLPKEQRTIDVDYVIPSYLEDHVTFSVLIFNDEGIQIGRKDVYLINDLVNSNEGISTNPSLEIKNIKFVQGELAFEPTFGNSAYLINGKENTSISVNVSGKNIRESLISINFRNIHNSTSSSTLYAAIDSNGDVGTASVTLNKDSLEPGLYEVLVAPVNVKKEQVGPSKKINIGVEGLVGVIQAFNLDTTNNIKIEKGSRLRILVDWMPLVEISKTLSSLEVDPNFKARVTLFDSKKEIIGTSTISNIGATFILETIINKEADEIWGKVEVVYDDVVMASYEKKLFVEKIVNEKSNNFNMYLFVLVAFVALLAIFLWRKNKIINVSLFLLILSISAPHTTFAAWTLKSTTAFDNTYPKASDSATTTWSSLGYPWAGVAAYSRACTKKTATTGTSSNYVTQTLPIISSDEKMYPWENSWYHIPVGGWNWYQANKARNGSWPTLSGGLVPGVFANSSFVHANSLARTASVDDDLTGTLYTSSWKSYRPFRLNASNGMGTNIRSALATTTFSNLSNWLAVTFNVGVSSVTTYPTANMGFIASGGIRSAHLFPSTADAVHLDSIFDGSNWGDFNPGSSIRFNFPNNDANYSSLKNSLGIGTSTLSIWIDAAGRGTFASYLASDSRIMKSTDVATLNSRPGTYKLFNFLTTYRDEADGASASASQKYDCISANQRVYEADYEIVPNSFIEVIMFYDENQNQVFDPGEKKIANRSSNQTSIDGGFPINSSFPSSNSSCALPAYNQYLLNGVQSIQGTSTNPIAVLTSSSQYSTPHGKAKMSGAYVKTLSQVINPLHYPDLGTVSMPSYYAAPSGLLDARYIVTAYDASTNSNTPSAWAVGSGFNRSNILGKAFYNSSGNLTMLSGQAACGQTIVGNDGGSQDNGDGDIYTSYESLGEDLSYLHQTEVLNYPVPPAVANNTTPYFKFPINWALSRQYEVGVDSSLLPSGWEATTVATTVDMGPTAIGNQHYPVYLGVTYNANGVCGSAVTTPSGSPVTSAPSSNLCSVGSSTAVTAGVQDFTWSCNGYGTGSTASCTKPKCGGTNSHYCAVTNSCVASEGACQIAGVCGSATAQPGRSTTGQPTQPSTDLCSAGTLNGLVADGGASSFVWTCSGTYGGATSPTCSQPKCSSAAGLQYCSAVNECRSSCPVTSTSTLIFDAKLTPRVVRKSTDQCILSWNTSSSEELPVSCKLNGVSLGGPSPAIQRSTPVSVGSHTLSCTNGEQDQSTTTKCLLNPSYKEI